LNLIKKIQLLTSFNLVHVPAGCYVSANALAAFKATNIDRPNATYVVNAVRVFDIHNAVNIIVIDTEKVMIPTIWYPFMPMYDHPVL
jgi:hypothetical protein